MVVMGIGLKLLSEEASEATTELFGEINFTENLNNSLYEIGNMSVETDVCVGSSEFICGQYAHAISGIFAWSALIMACFQVITDYYQLAVWAC